MKSLKTVRLLFGKINNNLAEGDIFANRRKTLLTLASASVNSVSSG